jgi:hypothetical protein
LSLTVNSKFNRHYEYITNILVLIMKFGFATSFSKRPTFEKPKNFSFLLRIFDLTIELFFKHFSFNNTVFCYSFPKFENFLLIRSVTPLLQTQPSQFLRKYFLCNCYFSDFIQNQVKVKLNNAVIHKNC